MSADEQTEPKSILSQRTPSRQMHWDSADPWPGKPAPRCWCNGLGGKELVAVPQDGVDTVLVFLRTCVCDKGMEEELRTIQYLGTPAERENRHRVALLWKQAEIPERFTYWRLKTSPNASLAARLYHPALSDDANDAEYKAFDEALEAWDGSWFLWGGYGTGKTGLAVGYAYEFVDIEMSTCLFRSLPDLLSELRSTYGRTDGPTEMELLSKYAHVG